MVLFDIGYSEKPILNFIVFVKLKNLNAMSDKFKYILWTTLPGILQTACNSQL